MAHYLIGRRIPAPGRIVLTCSCGSWSADGSPDVVRRSWVRHSGETGPSVRPAPASLVKGGPR